MDKPLIRREVTRLDLDAWFSGFVDGEGCFVIRKVQRSGSDSFYPRLQIKLRDDDTDVLQMAPRTFGGGLCRVERSARDLEKMPKSNPYMQWRVDRSDDLIRLVAYFDTFPLRAKKAQDYRTWRKAVLLIRDGLSTNSRRL